MKFTTEQVQELLKSIGIADAEIVEEGSDFNQDEALTAIDAARATILKPKHRAEMLEELTGQTTRMADAAITKKLKALTGIDSAELKDLTYEEKIEKAFEHTKNSLGKDTEGLREEIKSILAKRTADQEAAKKEKDDLELSWKNKWSEREIKSSLETLLKDAPLLEGADRAVLAEDLKNSLMAKYHVSYDEATRAVNLFTKDNPEMPALNDAKTAPIALLDEAKNFLTPRGIWQTDMRNKKPDPTKGEPYKKPEGGSAFDPPTNADPLDAFNKQREALFSE